MAAQKARTSEPSTAYLVLGMHRSGTSAVTQLLALAGAELPANVMPGDEHNQQGYFEPWRIALFNDERLRAAGGAWDDVFGFPFRPLSRREERPWLLRAEALFEEEYAGLRTPLLKDPRITVLMPFWRTVFEDLGLKLRAVIPVRHPLAVAGSLARRNDFSTQKSVLLWASYMLAAEAYTRDIPRVFVDYDSLLADWRAEVARIEAAHGAKLPKLTEKAAKAIDGFLSPELRHNEGDGDLADLGWAGALAADVFAWCRAAAADRTQDTAGLDRAGAALEARREEMGELISPITRDLDSLRLELRETRARLEAEVAEVRATWKRDVAELEHGWKRDVADLERGWKRDVAGLQRELKAFYQAIAKADAELDAALREP